MTFNQTQSIDWFSVWFCRKRVIRLVEDIWQSNCTSTYKYLWMIEKRTSKYFGLRPGHSVRNEHSHVCKCHPDKEPHISIGPSYSINKLVIIRMWAFKRCFYGSICLISSRALCLALSLWHIAPLYGTFSFVSFQGNGMQSYTGHMIISIKAFLSLLFVVFL